MENHHTVAGPVVLHALADRCDYARGFVSEDAGGGVGACGYLFKVGAADAAGVDADQHLSRADFGYRDVLQADIIHSR